MTARRRCLVRAPAIDYSTPRLPPGGPRARGCVMTGRAPDAERTDMLTWNSVWDDIYRSRAWGRYPKEELIRFVARRYYGAPDRKEVRFLDLGCGPGAATWFIAREGFTVDAIDGSAVAIETLRARLAAENLHAQLAVGDIGDLPYAPATFDCVVDIACLMCNGPAETRHILRGVLDRLKPGGRLFSVTPRAGCWGDGLGEQVAECTFRDSREGPFAGMGTARFSSERQIRELYRDFDPLTLDVSDNTIDGGRHRLSHWIIEGVKR